MTSEIRESAHFGMRVCYSEMNYTLYLDENLFITKDIRIK